MGIARRMRCKKLPAKLKRIRKVLGMTQPEMAAALGFPQLRKQHVFNYELPHTHKDNMEPPYAVLLRYAELAGGICPTILMNDRLKLPNELPVKKAHDPQG
jgi:transcriptional regulator with XRE-family HTH domain